MAYLTYLEYDANDSLIQLAKKLTGYNGKKYSVRVHDSATFKPQPSYWDGGSRTTTHLVTVDNMATAKLPNFHPFFDGQVIPEEFEWKPGIIAVEYTQGYLESITFVVHPNDWTARALPEVPELSRMEQLVLVMTRGLTSAGRKNDRERYRIKDSDWESAKESLIAKELLIKNGAITVKGRNVAGDFDMYKLQRDYPFVEK